MYGNPLVGSTEVRTGGPATGFGRPCSLHVRGVVRAWTLENGPIFVYGKILSLLSNVQNYLYSALSTFRCWRIGKPLPPFQVWCRPSALGACLDPISTVIGILSYAHSGCGGYGVRNMDGLRLHRTLAQFSVRSTGMKMTWATAIRSERCCRVGEPPFSKVPVSKHETFLDSDRRGPCSYAKLEIDWLGRRKILH